MSAYPGKAFVTMTEAQYLTFERASPDEKREIMQRLGYAGRMLDPEGRHEYIDGRVVAMSGASENHNLITTNLIIEVGGQLRGRGCKTYGSDMRVYMPLTGRYVYPDVSAVCNEAQFAEEKRLTLLNPQLLIEVLSPATAMYDRSNKFHHYMTLTSLREYVLVSQDEPLIERFVRQQNDSWLLTVVQGLDAEITFESISCTVPLAEVYRSVSFGDGA